MCSYSFESKFNLEYKTLISQEMLKKGVLASTNFYASIAHSKEKIDMYFNFLDDIYRKISKCESNPTLINNLLEGPVCHSGFKRLN